MTMIRQMTQKGDPMLKVMLAEELKLQLLLNAKLNRRRVQDELIRSLAATFKFPEETLPFSREQLNQFANIGKYAQVIPRPLMDSLQNSAQKNNFDLTEEVNLRLLFAFKAQQALELNTLSEKILKHKFRLEEALAECKRNHEHWVYVYELEKLRLYVKFKHKLPRNIKEVFTILNVKEAIKQIERELEAEDDKDQGS